MIPKKVLLQAFKAGHFLLTFWAGRASFNAQVAKRLLNHSYIISRTAPFCWWGLLGIELYHLFSVICSRHRPFAVSLCICISAEKFPCFSRLASVSWFWLAFEYLGWVSCRRPCKSRLCKSRKHVKNHIHLARFISLVCLYSSSHEKVCSQTEILLPTSPQPGSQKNQERDGILVWDGIGKGAGFYLKIPQSR